MLAREPSTRDCRLGRLLLVTLEAARVDADLPVLGALRSWLDSWRGIGNVERGMARQGYDLQLTRYDEKGWRATFYTTGMEHSITSATASAWERTPWHASRARRGRRSGGEVTIDSVGGNAVERDQAAMTIEYEATAQDIVNLQRYWYRHKMRRRWSFGFLLALANGLALGLLLAGPPLTVRSIIYYFACSALFLSAWSILVYGVAPVIAKRITKRMIQKGKYLGVVGRHIIRLEVGGCRETTDVNESFHAWRGIDTLEVDARYVYIFLHGGSGYIIPRRAFPNAAASDGFIAAARRLHAAGSEAGAPTSASA